MKTQEWPNTSSSSLNLRHWLIKASARSVALMGILLLLAHARTVQAQTWTLTSAPSNTWGAVACSADGSTILAAAQAGGLYLSTNSGTTWVSNNVPPGWWGYSSWGSGFGAGALAVSADGTKLFAANCSRPECIYLSTNAGATWAVGTSTTNITWQSVCASADGSKVFATGLRWSPNPGPPMVYGSKDSGATWLPVMTNHFSTDMVFSGIATSADGTRLIAVPGSGEATSTLFLSVDGGVSWTTNKVKAGLDYPPYNAWDNVSSSADGLTLVGARYRLGIYVSADGGATWAATNTLYVTSVACSADGRKLRGVGRVPPLYDEMGLFSSSDSGGTWELTSLGTVHPWALASSADGSMVVGAVYNGGIYLLQSIPTPELGIRSEDGGLVLSWTVPSIRFALQESTTLDSPNWVDVTTAPVLNYTNLHYEVRAAMDGNRFYRLLSRGSQ